MKINIQPSPRAVLADADSKTKDCAPRAYTRARKVLVFELAGQSYGLDVAAIREILFMSSLSRPPGLPPLVVGFLNLSGAILPVVKLARLFGVAQQPSRMYTPLLIVQSGAIQLALLVDAVKAIAAIDDSKVVAFHENDCADGLATVGETNIVVLSTARLLREHEQCRLAELADIERVRQAEFEVASP